MQQNDFVFEEGLSFPLIQDSQKERSTSMF